MGNCCCSEYDDDDDYNDTTHEPPLSSLSVISRRASVVVRMHSHQYYICGVYRFEVRTQRSVRETHCVRAFIACAE